MLLHLYQFPLFAPLPSAPPNYSLIKMKFHKFDTFQIFNGQFTWQWTTFQPNPGTPSSFTSTFNNSDSSCLKSYLVPWPSELNAKRKYSSLCFKSNTKKKILHVWSGVTSPKIQSPLQQSKDNGTHLQRFSKRTRFPAASTVPHTQQMTTTLQWLQF